MRNWLTLGFSFACLACSSSGSVASPPADTGGGSDVVVDSPADSADGAKTVPPGGEQACRDAWAPTCKQFEACAPVTFKGVFKDQTDCVDHYTPGCVAVYTDPNVDSSLDKEKACGGAEPAFWASKGCSAWYRAFWTVNEADPKALPECMLTGTLPSGATCTFGADCASGWCDIQKGKFCGTCGDRIAKGGSCLLTKPVSCEPATTCISGKCTSFGELGADCDGTHPCHIDFACLAGKCAARLKDGDTCDGAKGGNECEINHWCNSVTAKCEPWKQAKLSQPCGLDATAGGISVCEYGAACKITDTAAYVGVCVARAKLGEACTFNGPLDSQCEFPLACKDGTCTRLAWDTCK